MSTLNLILAEIRFRFVNFLLCLLVVVIAAALFIVGPTLISGYAEDTNEQLSKLEAQAEQMEADTKKELAEMDKQTKRIMRDLGVNLRIVHKDTNMANLYTDFVAVDFPEDYVHRLAQAESIETIVHLVATLQARIKWENRTALLVGTLPVLTQSQKNEEKPHMVRPVEKATVLLGHELGAGLKDGDTIQVEGHELKIAKIMPEYGSLQDVQLVTNLEDAQKILQKPDRINQIMALNCKCKGDRISVIRAELEGVLPDTKVTEHLTNATAREKQRDLVEADRARKLRKVESNLKRVSENRGRQQKMLSRLISIMTPLVVLTSALFVALMTWLNVRERRSEIGVLRALGKGAANVAVLFLGKSLLLGLIGGAVGCLLGYYLTLLLGNWIMKIGTDLFVTDIRLVIATVVGAPLITVMASYLPTLSAISQDPAIVLMDN
ncbi:MAG: FtsX-like permease family protein [Planctomycetes bacterium]|nr:FtsX-like permease family protein [Planctomycetota bacterium]MBL7044402.1 FtsX-like permease family protein [Pirellulaceae bacterium]